MKTAILVDADFYLRQHRWFFGVNRAAQPQQVADDLWTHCIKHIDRDRKHELYRIFVYDCPPLQKKVHHPQTKQCIDLNRSDLAIFRRTFHQELCKKRNVALRLGNLDERNARWKLKKPDVEKQVLRGQRPVESLDASDFVYHANQKGVDMKIGLDIAALTLKKLANRIVLIAGDSDFVPASKFARREGVEFVLDPMRKRIGPDLLEHVDGLQTTFPRRTSTDRTSNTSTEAEHLDNSRD